VQYVNVDHNSMFFVNHPVIVTPLRHQQYLKDKYFLNVLMNQDTNAKDIQLYQSISVELDPFVVKIEQLFIQALMEFIGVIQAHTLFLLLVHPSLQAESRLVRAEIGEVETSGFFACLKSVNIRGRSQKISCCS
jgi:hypothetical protein